MIEKDKTEYGEYLRRCTTQQVWDCYDEATRAERDDYVDLCVDELFRRGLK